MENHNEEVFRIDDLTFFYPNQENPTLRNISLTVEKGDFVVLCGASGSGKSTLLRHLKTVLTPHGHRKGEIYFCGKPLTAISERVQSQSIGFVGQSPDNQIVTDKVWHELAFGLESLGFDTEIIRKRVAEIASFFGMQTWFHKDVATLSGGQKQLLNLASVMAMQVDVLILDEPTSQLDPIAGAELIGMLGKVNREFGTTIFMTEHRLEEVFPVASKVAVMDSSELLFVDTPKKVAESLQGKNHGMFLSMPTPMRVWGSVESNLPCPLTVSEGRNWLHTFAENTPLFKLPEENLKIRNEAVAIAVEEVSFRYAESEMDIVKNLKLSIKKGEFFAILGGNGTGKTTALKLILGLAKPNRGTVKITGTIAMLPQNPQALFVKKTVKEDLLEVFSERKMTEEDEVYMAEMIACCRIEKLLSHHPYDTSGGEQQRIALCKVLLRRPDVLLLDEPTKGLDAEFKLAFAEILQELLKKNVTVCMVSHDIEFCANHTTRCALFFDGGIVAEDTPRQFFSGNRFYTTAANRMGRELIAEVVTAEELILACGGTTTATETATAEITATATTTATAPTETTTAPPPLHRKIIGGVALFLALILMVQMLGNTDLTALVDPQGISQLGQSQWRQSLLFVAMLVIFTVAMHQKSEAKISPIFVEKEEKKLQLRTKITGLSVLLLMPLTLFLGVGVFGGTKYYFVAFLLIIEAMFPFFIVFEGRKPQARELVLIAVLCAMAVAGRMAFFMLPQIKPVMAIAIISGVVFGGEVGFFVGAMSMLVSNIVFSQGPWTPWQMFAMGSIGFLAGLVFKKGGLQRTKLLIATFGAIAAIVIYGGIMNPSQLLLYAEELSWELLLMYYITGLPIDIVHSIGTFLFLWYGAEPLIEKLERVKEKYGLL
ncbi:MAG: ATP-binding cassette domain-containing protein [Bacillota bacterium]